ncbi:MAG TPA: hypothetical protein VF310_14365, partial [Vicinamibacteria bacterium]
AYPYTVPAPLASVINYATVPGLNLANTTILPTCIGCGFDFEVQADGSPAQLVADVVGYFVPSTRSGDITAITTNPGSGLTGGVQEGAANLAIAPSGVDTAKLGPGAVTGPKISINSVGVSHLNTANGAVPGTALTWNGSALIWQAPTGFTLPFDGTATAAGAVFTARNGSTAADAFGVQGVITATAPGSYSAAVRGINNGTGGTGIGVYGSQAGAGWGVFGTTGSGIGVNGAAGAGGTGVVGQGSTGVLARALSSAGAALALDGAVRVVGSMRPAFVHVVQAANACDASTTGIDHPHANDDPLALLIVTPNISVPIQVTTEYSTIALGPCPANRWRLKVKASSGPDIFLGDRYHVLVIKNP